MAFTTQRNLEWTFNLFGLGEIHIDLYAHPGSRAYLDHVGRELSEEYYRIEAELVSYKKVLANESIKATAENLDLEERKALEEKLSGLPTKIEELTLKLADVGARCDAIMVAQKAVEMERTEREVAEEDGTVQEKSRMKTIPEVRALGWG